MTIAAIMPIKLFNERLPGKNTRILGNKPLIRYQLEALLGVGLCNSISVFCSDKSIIPLLPDGVDFIQRSPELDLTTSNFTQIFSSFLTFVDSDIYVYVHATAPFITVNTINMCINAVKSGNHDSAFSAVKIQDFLWRNGQPLNFDAANIPRSQDILPIYRETSGVYVFLKSVFEKYQRKVGISPYICEVSFKESIDINFPDDFKLAEILLNSDL